MLRIEGVVVWFQIKTQDDYHRVKAHESNKNRFEKRTHTLVIMTRRRLKTNQHTHTCMLAPPVHPSFPLDTNRQAHTTAICIICMTHVCVVGDVDVCAST